MINKLKNKLWLSIIEVLIWIFIFSMWLASVYVIISSSMKLNDYNKDYIIATALVKEQIELITNYRDSNYSKMQKYNQINTLAIDYNNLFKIWSYYKIENDYSDSASFPILLEEITDFWEWEGEIGWKMQNYKLCLDTENRYTYNCSWDNEETSFFKYIYIDNVKYSSWWVDITVENAIKIKSKVIWYKRGYHEFDTDIILTDWKRL